MGKRGQTIRENIAMLKSIPFCFGPGEPQITLHVGDYVLDDLTGKITTIKEILKSSGPMANISFKLDSNYLDGWRHSWEISQAKERIIEYTKKS